MPRPSSKDEIDRLVVSVSASLAQIGHLGTCGCQVGVCGGTRLGECEDLGLEALHLLGIRHGLGPSFIQLPEVLGLIGKQLVLELCLDGGALGRDGLAVYRILLLDLFQQPALPILKLGELATHGLQLLAGEPMLLDELSLLLVVPPRVAFESAAQLLNLVRNASLSLSNSCSRRTRLPRSSSTWAASSWRAAARRSISAHLSESS